MAASHSSQEASTTIIGLPIRTTPHLRNWCWDRMDAPQMTQPDWASNEAEFKIRLADEASRRSSASMLINRRYAWRGYASTDVLNESPNRVTLVAGTRSATIGTISINFDGPDGLLVDELFRDELEPLRDAGHRLCEFIKLAVDGEVRSKRVLGALFHIAMIFARNIHGATDLMIEVNPRHVRFYQRMLGFTSVGEPRWNTRVNAPAVLMRLEFEKHHHRVEKFGGHPEMADIEKSFYPYFFAPHEEEAITRRLAARPGRGVTHD